MIPPESLDARKLRLKNQIADHCIEIEDLFKVPVRVTCIVRVAGKPEQDVLVTSESDLAEITALVERSKGRAPINERNLA